MTVVREIYNGKEISYEKSTVNSESGKSACSNIDSALTDSEEVNRLIVESKELIPKYEDKYDVLGTAIVNSLDKIIENLTKRDEACKNIKTNITTKCQQLDDDITRSNRQSAINSISNN